MSWFKRNKEGITTSTKEKKETPEGLWQKCSNCKAIFASEDLKENYYVCDRCNHHERVGSQEYFDIIFDEGKYKALVNVDEQSSNQCKSWRDYILSTKFC